ncbi:MAG: LmeA family phospholipid-binding protein [Fimbriimonadaceae bacterium]|nr:LmeA family phospholipid-binding protein [Fimbriimonadaceae bacterium]
MVALLIALGIGSGLADREIGIFERAAARDIAARLTGGEKEVEVQVEPAAQWGRMFRAEITGSRFSLEGLPLFAEPNASRAGRLDRLTISLRDFRLRGLRIEELGAEIPNSRFDLGLALKEKKIRVTQSGEGTGWVKILENDLAEYIVAKFAEIKSATVKIDRDVIWVEGYGEFLVVKSDFAVIAKVASPDGRRLMLENAKIYFNWQRADPFASQALLRILNPVVDLDKDLGLAGAIDVKSIRLRGGHILASGSARIPPKPAENP